MIQTILIVVITLIVYSFFPTQKIKNWFKEKYEASRQDSIIKFVKSRKGEDAAKEVEKILNEGGGQSEQGGTS